MFTPRSQTAARTPKASQGKTEMKINMKAYPARISILCSVTVHHDGLSLSANLKLKKNKLYWILFFILFKSCNYPPVQSVVKCVTALITSISSHLLLCVNLLHCFINSFISLKCLSQMLSGSLFSLLKQRQCLKSVLGSLAAPTLNAKLHCSWYIFAFRIWEFYQTIWRFFFYVNKSNIVIENVKYIYKATYFTLSPHEQIFLKNGPCFL